MDIGIVIPTYNERDNIAKLLKKIFYLGIQGLEVIVVDDNSPDGTGVVVKKMLRNNPKIHLVERPKKMGLGTAYIKGFNYALKKGARLIFEMDADFSHDPLLIPKFIKASKNKDIVIGSRYKGGIRIINWPLRRLALSLLANKYACFVTGLKITDCTSGFKCYRREVLESIPLKNIFSNGYSFQIEMKYRSQRKGFSLEEIPIIFTDRHAGTSKISKYIILEAFFIVWKLRLGLYK